jgi:cytoskeleton protein RodZ
LPAQPPSQPLAQLPNQPAANPATPAAPPPSTTSTLLPNPLAAGGQAAEPSPADVRDASPAAAGPTAAPEAAPEAAATPAAPLVLSYRGPSWTEVRDRSGQLLIARLVTAGSQQSVRGVPPFDLVIGNAHAVTLTYQGKPIDLSRYTRQNVARLRLS